MIQHDTAAESNYVKLLNFQTGKTCRWFIMPSNMGLPWLPHPSEKWTWPGKDFRASWLMSQECKSAGALAHIPQSRQPFKLLLKNTIATGATELNPLRTWFQHISIPPWWTSADSFFCRPCWSPGHGRPQKRPPWPGRARSRRQKISPLRRQGRRCWHFWTSLKILRILRDLLKVRILNDFKGSTESTVCRVDVHWMNIGWNYRIKSKAYADETPGQNIDYIWRIMKAAQGST